MIYFTTVKKSIIFLYTSNKKSENKIKKTIPLIMASKKKKQKKFNKSSTKPVHCKVQNTAKSN